MRLAADGQLQKKRYCPDLPALLGAAVGAVLFLLVYGPATLNPTYDSWIYNGYIGVDLLQHYTGWVAFRAGDWAFPLTFTTMLHWPVGGLAALADCVPLLAIPFKLLGPLLPETFQYFGWFALLCMAMSGWAGAKLLGLFGLSPACRVLGSVLFATAPTMLERLYQHTGLGAHFLVILAIYFYFKYRRSDYNKFPWQFIPLAAAAVFTHVYFVPMVLALAFAAAVDGLLARRRLNALAALGGSVTAALLSGFVLGYFAPSEYVSGGFGRFGVNLNTFWNPVSWNWPTWDASYRHLGWSRFLPGLPVVGDSIGSFSYLGLGVLAALLVCAVVYAVRLLFFARGKGFQNTLKMVLLFLKNHAGLAFSCLCLGVFAVSNVVTANSRTLFTLPLPDALLRLCDVFRSSGRMIWPIYYLLMLCAIWGVARLFRADSWLSRSENNWRPPPASEPHKAASWGVIGNGDTGSPRYRRLKRYTDWRNAAHQRSKSYKNAPLAPLLLAAVVALQLVDIGGALAQKRAYFARPVVPAAYAAPENWEKITQKGRVFYQLELNEDRVTALRAAAEGMPTNFFLAARGTPKALLADMAATRASLLAGALPEAPAGGIVYLTSDAELAAQLTESLAGLCEAVPFEGYTAFLPLE